MARWLMISISVFLITTLFAAEPLNIPDPPERTPLEQLSGSSDLDLVVKQKRIDEICERMIHSEIPQEIPKGPHVELGKAAEWVINHTNRLDGWSLTGWADLKISDDFKRARRVKIGLINGELDSSLYEELDDKDLQSYRLLDEWERRRTRHPVFGICITFTF